jgi:hypothetical protein
MVGAITTFGIHTSTGACAILRHSIQQILISGLRMSVKVEDEVASKVPAEDFQALEEKIYRTIEMYKSAREARAVAERDAKRLREQLEEREEEVETLRREMVQLRKEREDIRGRVEKMLGQIEALAE